MHNWFECKVSFEKMLENGMQKKVTEPYLVDALSFTEAESRIIEEIRPFITGEFTVTDIKRARIPELFFNENGDRYYKIKVYFITLDEKSGAEKKTAAQMLAQASTLKEAIAVLEEGILLRLYPDDEDTIYQIVDLLVDTCDSKRKLIRIAGDDKPAEVVLSRLKKLNADHIRFVLDCLAANTSPIRNMKQYLLAALFNAPTTIQLYYQNKVNHDLAARR